MTSTNESKQNLNGLTVLRFAHAFETGGGMEQLLDDLDRVLLARNAMTIIRVFIAADRNQLDERAEQIGKGRLICVPFPLPEGESLQIASDEEESGINLKHMFRDFILYNPLIWQLFTRKFLLHWRIPRKKGQLIGVGVKVADLMERYLVDLIMLHFMGGSDSDEIIDLARSRGVPFALQNHYANERFLHLSIRKHAILANSVAGVNALGLPSYLRGRFWNLSDGIDTEFMKRENANAISDLPGAPIILLPARVVRPKGHMDLIEAGAILQKRGLDFRIAFAGRVDSTLFVEELRKVIHRYKLEDKVQFLGALSQEKLRDWYAASAVVAFPTYHHEGLGRVTVEAQAMQTPPVAYATGGVPEGLIPDRTGLLLRTGDIEGLAKKLEELITNPHLRQQMGEEGRRFVEEHFSLDAVAQRHEEFYRFILNAPRVSE
jgi:glycosyltransferase involved in cell wall biosynthesis